MAGKAKIAISVAKGVMTGILHKEITDMTISSSLSSFDSSLLERHHVIKEADSIKKLIMMNFVVPPQNS